MPSQKKSVPTTTITNRDESFQRWLLHFLQGLNIGSLAIPGQMYSFILMAFFQDAGKAGAYNSTLQSIQSLLVILSGPIVGQCSDAMGRKPILLASTLTTVFCRWAMLRNMKSRSALILARVGGSIGMAWSTLLIAASLSDLAKDDSKKRQRYTSTDMAMRGVGIMFGPLIGGYLATNYNNRTVLRSSTLLAAAMSALVAFSYKETCAAEDRRPMNAKAFKKVTGLLGFTNFFGKDKDLAILAICYAMQDFAIKTGPIFGVAANLRFGYDQSTIGRWISVYGLSIMTPAFLIPKFIKQYGERGTIYAGLFFSTLASGCLGLPSASAFWLSLVGFMLGNMKASAIKSTLLKRGDKVLDVGKGELSGYASSMINVSGMISPQIHSYTFSTFNQTFPGMPWITCSAVNAVSMLLFSGVSLTTANFA
jgi:MFS transporter, DHA1 family, tetracycline resistance protein